MNEQRQFKDVPVGACRFDGGIVEFGDNGDNAKSGRIRLKARSGGSIDHWYWGKVVHDFAGMRVHKPRLTVDYAHNDSEVLGYVNRFETESGDLILSGALTPWREDDRASEVMFKMREGVPYEASIFFGGDGIKIQEIAEGQIEQVNGREFAGPGVVIREWPLRGVAICPYGADANTDSMALKHAETLSAETWTPTKEKEMANKPESVEAEAKLAEGAEPVEAVAVEAEGSDAVEEVAEDTATEATEQEASEVVKADDEAAPAELSASAPGETVTKLAAERDDALSKLAALQADVAQLTEARDAAILAKIEAEKKLAAFVDGESVASAAPAEGKTEGSLMERARKGKK